MYAILLTSHSNVLLGLALLELGEFQESEQVFQVTSKFE